MSGMISGGCLCGKVRFEIINEFKQFHLCHCSECRKITGSAHASNLFAEPNNINWLSGVVNIKRFDYPNGDLSTAFCTECGSCVPYLSNSGESLIVPAGSLNENPGMTPQDNIFWSERAVWYDEGVLAKHYEAFPE